MNVKSPRTIESFRNPIIAQFRDHFSRSGHRKSLLFPVEGPQLVVEAIQAGLCMEAVLFHQQFAESGEGSRTLEECAGTTARIYKANQRLLRRAAATESPQGILALFQKPILKDVDALTRMLLPILVLMDVQDPGNCGALVRTFVAFGGQLIVTVGSSADLYGPKAVRASAGAAFRAAILHIPTMDEFRRFQPLARLPWIGTSPSGGSSPECLSTKLPFVLLIGNEGAGLPASILKICQERLCLPIRHDIESLNAAVAGSLIIYELARSLHFGPFKQAAETT